MGWRDEVVEGGVVRNEVRSWQNPFGVLGAAIEPTYIRMSLAKRTFEGTPRIVEAGHAGMSAWVASVRVLSLATWHDDGGKASSCRQQSRGHRSRSEGDKKDDRSLKGDLKKGDEDGWGNQQREGGRQSTWKARQQQGGVT